MKYIIILVLMLISGILFINKDKFSSLSATGNEAAAIKSAINSGSGQTYYTLKTESVDNRMGTVSPLGSKKYKAGTVVTVTAKSKVGYVFEDWDGDDDSCLKKESCTVTIDEDKYLTASFKPVIKIQDPNKCYAFINKLFTGGSQKTFEQESLSIINNPNLSKTEKDQKLKKLLKKYLPFGVPDKDKFEMCIGFHYEWPW